MKKEAKIHQWGLVGPEGYEGTLYGEVTEIPDINCHHQLSFYLYFDCNGNFCDCDCHPFYITHFYRDQIGCITSKCCGHMFFSRLKFKLLAVQEACRGACMGVGALGLRLIFICIFQIPGR